jgi:hypothetical protein
MNKIILGTLIAASLAIPAYADPTADDCTALKQASDHMASLIEEDEKKDLPLNDADKQQMKEAIEAFGKALKNFYEIDDKKVAKKRPKSIGSRFLAGLGALRSTNTAGYGSPIYGGGGNAYARPLGLPTVIIGPPSASAPAGMYPVMNMGCGIISTPCGLPR